MPPRQLIERRTRLALQTDIPDMQAYAEEWNKLGAEFEAEGYRANAEICFSNWKRYLGDCGAYRRMFDGPVAELKPADVTIRLDGQTVRFPDVDTFAGWLAGVME